VEPRPGPLPGAPEMQIGACGVLSFATLPFCFQSHAFQFVDAKSMNGYMKEQKSYVVKV